MKCFCFNKKKYISFDKNWLQSQNSIHSIRMIKYFSFFFLLFFFQIKTFLIITFYITDSTQLNWLTEWINSKLNSITNSWSIWLNTKQLISYDFFLSMKCNRKNNFYLKRKLNFIIRWNILYFDFILTLFMVINIYLLLIWIQLCKTSFCTFI